MNKKTHKKPAGATSDAAGLLTEAISRLGDKILFPEKVERARRYTRKAKMKVS